MATSTVVFTYTASSGDVSTKLTSLTEGGTAYASLTAAQIKTVLTLCDQASKLLRSPTQNGLAGAADVLASIPGGAGGKD